MSKTTTKMTDETKKISDAIIALCDTGLPYVTKKFLENGCYSIDNMVSYTDGKLAEVMADVDQLAAIEVKSPEQIRRFDAAVRFEATLREQLPTLRSYHEAWMRAHAMVVGHDWRAASPEKDAQAIRARLSALRKAS